MEQGKLVGQGNVVEQGGNGEIGEGSGPGDSRRTLERCERGEGSGTGECCGTQASSVTGEGSGTQKSSETGEGSGTRECSEKGEGSGTGESCGTRKSSETGEGSGSKEANETGEDRGKGENDGTGEGSGTGDGNESSKEGGSGEESGSAMGESDISDMDEDIFMEVVSSMTKVQNKWETYNQELAEKIQDIVLKTIKGEKELNAEYKMKQKTCLEKRRAEELEKTLKHSTKRMLEIDTKRQELKEAKHARHTP